MRTVTVLILCILNSYGLNLAKSYDNQSIENYNNSSCRNMKEFGFAVNVTIKSSIKVFANVKDGRIFDNVNNSK